jgi:hypothetical protein
VPTSQAGRRRRRSRSRSAHIAPFRSKPRRAGNCAPSPEWLVGFYLVDCASEDQAIERAKAICTDEHHAIEIRPVLWNRGP